MSFLALSTYCSFFSFFPFISVDVLLCVKKSVFVAISVVSAEVPTESLCHFETCTESVEELVPKGFRFLKVHGVIFTIC